MARKPTSPIRALAHTTRPSLAPATRVRLPNPWRTVTPRKLDATAADKQTHTARREVPEIRLSGAWLERIGFPKGRRYLISADREIETIYLQAEPILRSRRRK
jgi:hypothetical protein